MPAQAVGRTALSTGDSAKLLTPTSVTLLWNTIEDCSRSEDGGSPKAFQEL
jgi:hypothetical protein